MSRNFKKEVNTIQLILEGSRWAHEAETPAVLREYGRLLGAVLGYHRRANHAAYVTVKICRAVVQDLQDVLGIVSKGAGVLHGVLVVVGGPEQTRRPGSIAVCEVGFFQISLSVAIGVGEKVGIGLAVVGDGRASDVGRIGLNGRIETLAHCVELASDAFCGITIAVVISNSLLTFG